MRKKLIDAVLAGGSSQIFWYASLPLITRVYPQDSLGLFGQFMTYAGIISLIIGARADLAVLTSPQGDVAVTRTAFIKLSYILLACASVFLGVVAIFMSGHLFTIEGVTLLLCGGLISSKFLINGATLIKVDDYKSLRNTAFARSFVQSLVQIALFKVAVWGLLLGRIAGDFVGAFLRWRQLPERSIGQHMPGSARGPYWDGDELAAIKANSNAYRYSFPQTLLNAVSQGLPLIILPAFVSLQWVGQYTLAFTIAAGPVGLIATPIRQLLLARFSNDRHSQLERSRAQRVVAAKASLGLFALGMVGAVFIYFWAGPVIRAIFGPGWEMAAGMAVILWFWSATGLTFTPAISLLLSRDGNRTHLVIEAIQFAGRLAAILVGALFLEGTSIIIPFVVWSAMSNIAATVWILRPEVSDV